MRDLDLQLSDLEARLKARAGERARNDRRRLVNATYIELVDFWPRQPSPYGDHPYARNVSHQTWSVTESGNASTLRNESNYSGYVDAGYTRAGRGTARSWKDRGRESYAKRAVRKIRGRLKEVLRGR